MDKRLQMQRINTDLYSLKIKCCLVEILVETKAKKIKKKYIVLYSSLMLFKFLISSLSKAVTI